MRDWINVEDEMPPHMKEIRVYIDKPGFKPYEREKNAVWLAFDGNFYDAEEQESLYYVKKWRLA